MRNTFKLPLIVERTETGDYWGYSPALPGLHVLAATRAEVIALAPEVARALLEARLDKQLELPPAFAGFDGSQTIEVSQRIPAYEIPATRQAVA